MSVLHLDLESKSAVDLRKTGVSVYARDPTTDIWCVAYAVDDGPIKVRVPGDPCPQEIIDAVEQDWLIYAHNANFEATMWRHILAPRYGWPKPSPDQWRCTMAQALAMSLPASLENAALALGVDLGKDMQGRALMLRMAKPRKTNSDGTHVWWDERDKVERLIAYCKTDVRVERETHKRLLSLRPSEQDLWVLDQKINDRGV